MVFGQGYGEYVFESNSDGNMIQFFEYMIVEDDNSKKLNEVTYRCRKVERESGVLIESALERYKNGANENYAEKGKS